MLGLSLYMKNFLRNQIIAITFLFMQSGNIIYAQQNVGYQSYEFMDSLQIHLWYPGNVKGMGIYRNYLHNLDIKHLSTRSEPNVIDYMNEYLSGFVFSKQIKLAEILNIPVLNSSVQINKNRKYSLIIYAPGYRGLPFENSLLCEQLAQAGYVVASIPSIGIHHKTDSVGCEAQTNFIIEAIKFAGQNLSFVDNDNIHVIGFSWGGLSSIIASARTSSIKSVVSLDGSIRFFYGVAEKMPEFNPIEFDKPVLLFAAEGDDEFDFQFFDKLNRAPAYLVKMKGLSHIDFMAYKYLESPYKDIERARSYDHMVRIIKIFLSASQRKRSIKNKCFKEGLVSYKYFTK